MKMTSSKDAYGAEVNDARQWEINGARQREPSGGRELEIIELSECLRLLATEPAGRLGFINHLQPAIDGVQFVFSDGAVVIRADDGSPLTAAHNAMVSFEADHIDPDRRLGWSVTVIGRLHVVTDPVECERLSQLPLRPGTPGTRDHLMCIPVELATGRRLVPASRPPR